MSEYLKFEKICMEFPGVKALSDMSFGVNKGEIVAFLGENGAGKSTLLKILNGDYRHTSGKIYIDGKEVVFHSPNEAIKAGVSVIYQERQLAPYLSVAENIFMGNPPTKNGFIDFKELNKKAQEIIDEFGLPIAPETPVKKISVAFQQMVEIMKAYNRKADILCFDEPTAPLTDSEIVILFQIINKLKAQGKAIIYVSHRMNEMFELTDRVVVFKDGKLMGVEKTKEVTEAKLIKMMVGRDIGDVFNDLKRNETIGDVILEMKNVSTEYIKNINLQVRAGEIVGFSGLAGAGRTEVARAIFGADPIVSGEMMLKGERYAPKSPRDAMNRHIALCPEDRKLEGLSLILTVRENSSLAILGNLCKAGFVNFGHERGFTEKAVKEFNIKTPSIEQKVLNLSGGNQQKIVLARWMAMNPQLIIFDEPTKGIDVGAKSEIYQMICEAARKGVAVIMISSELPEVIGISDRIMVMKDGGIKAEIPRSEATEQLILSYAMLDENRNEKEAAI
ncbi:sugar ABC transporter ATP-binding protein [Hydrogenoanaerobacterium sp.]|uniref:sugar ABC transporter ATP-binding protein n=1 Tax=Hydrogenoanaerobacterium sp. TaxID=2953763 RepID=UPI0028A1CD03|nr:sugar ABC transporter ATP-binding protein [Hydrogenoanaerobacterium sp.]